MVQVKVSSPHKINCITELNPLLLYAKTQLCITQVSKCTQDDDTNVSEEQH